MTLIEQALSTATDTRVFRVGHGILPEVADVFASSFPGKTAKIVADGTTWKVAGKRVEALLRAAGVPCAKPLVLPAEPRPTATYENLCIVRDALAADGPDARAVAVGSGTINDLCKRASTELERPYLCVATAASVDGYASFGAPITKDNFKKTWPCAAPLAIVADTEILLTAPHDLTASGYADLAAKIPSGADWILADAVGADPIREDVWATTQLPLRGWINDPAGLKAGSPAAMDSLFTGLAMTGFAMQTTHTSRPASGAEHLFSHCWEMMEVRRPDGEHPSHGDKVGIGALSTTWLLLRFFDERFSADQIDAAIAAYPTWEARERHIRDILPAGAVCEEAIAASKAKFPDETALRERLGVIAARWDELAGRVREQLYPFDEFRAMLRAAGCPTTPEEIGVPRSEVYRAAYGAEVIRNRYTILDLLQDTGRLDRYVRGLDAIWG